MGLGLPAAPLVDCSVQRLREAGTGRLVEIGTGRLVADARAMPLCPEPRPVTGEIDDLLECRTEDGRSTIVHRRGDVLSFAAVASGNRAAVVAAMQEHTFDRLGRSFEVVERGEPASLRLRGGASHFVNYGSGVVLHRDRTAQVVELSADRQLLVETFGGEMTLGQLTRVEGYEPASAGGRPALVASAGRGTVVHVEPEPSVMVTLRADGFTKDEVLVLAGQMSEVSPTEWDRLADSAMAPTYDADVTIEDGTSEALPLVVGLGTVGLTVVLLGLVARAVWMRSRRRDAP